MLNKLLQSVIAADGRILTVQHGFDELRMRCSDGSQCDIKRIEDGLGTLWTLDIYTETDGDEVNISATTKRAADTVWIEVSDDTRGALIYDVLFVVSCLIRYGWWRYSVVVWDETEGELRVVHRDDVDGRRVVCDIIEVDGRHWSESEGETV